jgi:hypothetical protein
MAIKGQIITSEQTFINNYSFFLLQFLFLNIKLFLYFLCIYIYFQSLSFQVQAVADDKSRTSEATVVIHIEDINDNSPQFSQEV